MKLNDTLRVHITSAALKYESPVSCSWTLHQPPPGKELKLTFVELNIDHEKDILRIYDISSNVNSSVSVHQSIQPPDYVYLKTTVSLIVSLTLEVLTQDTRFEMIVEIVESNAGAGKWVFLC